MSKYGIGQPVLRFEDPRLLRGQGATSTTSTCPARPTRCSCARRMRTRRSARSTSRRRRRRRACSRSTPARVAADGLGMPKANMPRKRPDGKPMFAPQRPPLVHRPRALCRRSGGDGRRRDAGPGQGRGRAGRDRLRAAAVGDLDRGHGEAGRAARCGTIARTTSPTNVERGNKAATDEAMQGAAKVIKRRYVITRVHAQYMEPRGTLGTYDPGEDRMTLYADVQYPHRVRNMLAQNVFKVPESKMRVIAQRCRRRLRHQGLAIYRASPDPVGGAQAAAAR